MSYKFHYECVNCNSIFEGNSAMYLCPTCELENTIDTPPKGVLKVIYDYDQLKARYTRTNLIKRLERLEFLELLPIKSLKRLSYLNVGRTPVYEVISLDNKKLDYHLLFKDESQNPTFSFKDRASNIVSAYAMEKGFHTLCAASTGNAGSSLAGICASQNQEAIIFVPSTAPKAKLTQIMMYGARLFSVSGTYDQAFDLSVEASKEFGWYNRNTAYNPLTIEGKKTASFEIFLQIPKIPDTIFVPVGDGVILSGIFKGFEDLLKLEIIEKMPKIIAVQAEGSCNFIKNIHTKSFHSTSSDTIADSISVDIPRNFYMARDYFIKYKSESILVSDEQILNASKLLSMNTGIFSEPAGAAAFAGLLKYDSEGKIEPGSNNLVLLTGSGLKDIKSVENIINLPNKIEPSLKNVKKFLNI